MAPEAERRALIHSFESAWRAWFAPNLVFALGLLVLGVANFLLHARYPLVVAWLPAGLALAVVLLKGPRMIPGAVLGSAAVLLAILGEPATALVYGLASGFTTAAVWALLRRGVPSEVNFDTVRDVGRATLAAILVYGLTSLLLGSYAISNLIRHPLTAEADAHHVLRGVTDEGLAHDSEHARRARQHGTPATIHEAGSASHPEREAGTARHAGGSDLLEQVLTEPIGVLLLTPAVIYFRNLLKTRPRLDSGGVGVLALLIGVTLSIYSGYLEDRFGIVHTTLLVLPPAVWLALQYGLGYTLVGNVLVVLISGIGTALGHGPFNDHTSGLPLLTVVCSLTTLLVAAGRLERKSAEQTIQRLATHDALTGIPNRTAFTERMEQALYSSRRCDRKSALMFIDLDHFKKINDVLGHQVGDQLLAEVARRIQSCVREDSVLGRFGGDEFVVLVDHVEGGNAPALVAGRIASTLALPFSIDGHDCRIACSIGISIFPDHGASVQELLNKADAAMYEAKANGRSGFCFYSLER